jgi:alpha-beta hydrolase superfamily lysophospholipase
VEALKYRVNQGFERLVFDESFINGYKKCTLHKVMWMPKESPRAIIMVVHDIGDHMLRYQNFADFFNEEGIGVIGLDLRGHGKSGGHRGCASYSDLLKDVNELINYTQKRFPNIPKILYGHSLGGNLAMFYAIKSIESLHGIIASSPWIKSFSGPTPVITLSAGLMTKVYPYFTISNHVNAINLSHDLAVNNRYKEDKLVHRRISPRLFIETNRAGEIIMKSRHKCNIPLLIMHGSSDQITSWRASAEFAEYTSDKTTFKLWNGDYHELHNEFDKQKIFDYILGWIKNISPVQHVIYGNF